MMYKNILLICGSLLIFNASVVFNNNYYCSSPLNSHIGLTKKQKHSRAEHNIKNLTKNVFTSKSNQKTIFFCIDDEQDILDAKGIILLQLNDFPVNNLRLLTSNGEVKRIASYFMNPQMITLINNHNTRSYLDIISELKPKHILAFRKALNMNLILASNYTSVPLSCIISSSELSNEEKNSANNHRESNFKNLKKYLKTMPAVGIEKNDPQYLGISGKKNFHSLGLMKLCNLIKAIEQYKKNLGLNKKISLNFPIITMDASTIETLNIFCKNLVDLKSKVKNLKVVVASQFNPSKTFALEQILAKNNLRYFNWNFVHTTQLSSSANNLNPFFAKLNNALKETDVIINTVPFTQVFWFLLSIAYLVDTKVTTEYKQTIHEACSLLKPVIVYSPQINGHAYLYGEKTLIKTKNLLKKVLIEDSIETKIITKNFKSTLYLSTEITNKYKSFLSIINEKNQ